MKYNLEFSTQVRVTGPEAWSWITSFDGISKEMAPYMRMSTPRGVVNLNSVTWIPGQRLFRSWIKLFGIIPFDYSDLTLVSLENGVGFVEQSPMGTMRLWRHERRIIPNDKGCVIRDELTFEPRIAGRISLAIVGAFFAHRHRNLARYLGEKTANT